MSVTKWVGYDMEEVKPEWRLPDAEAYIAWRDYNAISAERDALKAEVERLRRVLRCLRLQHQICEDTWYSCPAATGDYACSNDAKRPGVCDCGADEHNDIIDAALRGEDAAQ